MKKRMLLLAFAVIGLVVLGFRHFNGAEAQGGPPVDDPRPLIGASNEEIGAYAVEYAKSAFTAQGEPVVLAAQHFNMASRSALGLGGGGYDPSRGYAISILQGDINVYGKFPGFTHGSPEEWQYKFIVLIFDATTGELAQFQTFNDSAKISGILVGLANRP